MKDPNDKHKWLIDDEASIVVKEIFRLCINGLGVSKIANELNNRNIMPPGLQNFMGNGIKIWIIQIQNGVLYC